MFRKNWRSHRRKLFCFYSFHRRAHSSSCFSPRNMVNKKFCLLVFVYYVCLPAYMRAFMIIFVIFICYIFMLLIRWKFNIWFSLYQSFSNDCFVCLLLQSKSITEITLMVDWFISHYQLDYGSEDSFGHLVYRKKCHIFYNVHSGFLLYLKTFVKSYLIIVSVYGAKSGILKQLEDIQRTNIKPK